MNDLRLADFAGYRARLEAGPAEWAVFDECCHITISRFFRDRGVFEILRRRVLPDIAARARREGRDARIWSAGCASGEEPYTVKILWDLDVASSFPNVSLSIIATEIDKAMLARAQEGCFEATSLHELPAHFVSQAFDQMEPGFASSRPIGKELSFFTRTCGYEMPASVFDLILCRYVAFTYFAPRRCREAFWIVSWIGSHPRVTSSSAATRSCQRRDAALLPLPGAPQIFTKQSNVAGVVRA